MFDYVLGVLNEKLFVASTLVAAGAYFFKVWGESKRDARHLLYRLMDIRKALLSYQLQMGKVGPQLTDSVTAALRGEGEEVDDVDLEDVREHVGKFFADLDETLFKLGDSSFTDQFDAALLEFAKRDPTRAFRIRSHWLMLKVSERQEKFFAETISKQIEDSFDNSETPNSVRAAFKEALQEVVDEKRLENIAGFLSDLNRDLLWLAWSSGPFVFCKILYRVAFTTITPMSGSVEPQEINEFLNKVGVRAEEKLKEGQSQADVADVSQ